VDGGGARIVDLNDGAIARGQGRPVIGVGQLLERCAVVLRPTDQARSSQQAGVDADRVELGDAQVLIERRRGRRGTLGQRLPLASRGSGRIGHGVGLTSLAMPPSSTSSRLLLASNAMSGNRVRGRAPRSFDDPSGGGGGRIVIADDLHPLIRRRIAPEDPRDSLNPDRVVVGTMNPPAVILGCVSPPMYTTLALVRSATNEICAAPALPT